MQPSTIIVFTALIAGSYALQCYHCNSITDNDCGDPFDPPSASKYLRNCSQLPQVAKAGEAVEGDYYCRKTTQKTSLRGMKDESVRVIRTCGFKNDPRLEAGEGENAGDLKCYRRAGTFETESYYCGCKEDACNPATRSSPSIVYLVGFVFTAIFCVKLH